MIYQKHEIPPETGYYWTEDKERDLWFILLCVRLNDGSIIIEDDYSKEELIGFYGPIPEPTV